MERGQGRASSSWKGLSVMAWEEGGGQWRGFSSPASLPSGAASGQGARLERHNRERSWLMKRAQRPLSARSQNICPSCL